MSANQKDKKWRTVDQKVFDFLNNGNPTLEELIDFLYEIKQPLLERWYYYLLGKNGELTKNMIEELEEFGNEKYGRYIDGRIYHWAMFLENESKRKQQIRLVLKKRQQNYTEQEVEELFFEEGWDYVYNGLRSDKESKNSQAASDFYWDSMRDKIDF